MKDAADKIGDAWLNNAGEAKEAIETLGLDLETLANMAPDQQLLAIAGALETVETTAEKVQIMESIGNDLSLLEPLLRDNAAGLQEMSDQADALGATLTSVEAAGIDEADEAIRKLDASFDAMGQTLAAQLGPALNDFVDDIAEELPKWITRADTAVLAFSASVMSVWEAFNPSGITESQSTFRESIEENMQLLREQRDALAGLGSPIDVPITLESTAEEAAEARRRQMAIELEELFGFEDQKTKAVREGNIARLKFSTWAAKQQTEHVVGEAIRITRGVAKENRALFEINKVAAIANAVINVHEGVSKSLSKYPWPLAGIMAALHAAAGAAEINAIRSASFSGGGGAPSSAGTGGTPSNPVPLPPPATGPIERGQAQIIIQGNVFANDDFRRALVDALQEAQQLDELEQLEQVTIFNG